MATTITGVSVIYYDEDGRPQEIGTQDQITVGTGTEKICQDFLRRLAGHKKFNETKRLHQFLTNNGTVVCPVHNRLVDLQHARNMQAAALAVAQHFATWRWMRHYVLLFIGYQRDGVDLLALIMSASASGDTFSFSPSKLVTELKRVFKRDMDKALQFPYYTPGVPGAAPDPSQAVVVQLNATAGYLVEALSLESAPTLLEVMKPRVAVALASGLRGRQITEAVSEKLQAEQQQGVAPLGQHNPKEMPVHIDLPGITLRATMADIHSGRLRIGQVGNRWEVIIADTADNMKVSIGGVPGKIHDLAEAEAAD